MISSDEATLVGFVNPIGSSPGFLLPIFRLGDYRTVQSIDENDNIADFVPLPGRPDEEIIPSSHPFVCSLGQKALYAFSFQDKSVQMGDQGTLAEVLDQKRSYLQKFPFVKLEVLRFLGEWDGAKSVVGTMRNILALENGELADEWATMQLASIEESARLGSSARRVRRLSSIVHRRGFLSVSSLEHEIRLGVGMYGSVSLKLKLVRSSIGMHPKNIKLLDSFGLRIKKLGSESGLLRFDKGMLNTFWRISRFVLILEAKLMGRESIVIKPLDVSRIRKKYFSKSTRQLNSHVPALDYQYEVDSAERSPLEACGSDLEPNRHRGIEGSR